MLESDSDYESSQDSLSCCDWRLVQRTGRHFSRRATQQRVVDSDSECEYQGACWGVSYSFEIPTRNLELVINPDEMRGCVGRSDNLHTMEETSTGPIVVSVDPSDLLSEVAIRSPNENLEPINLNFLERFLQMCSVNEDEQGKIRDVNMKLLPSSKWREEAISSFAKIRTQFEGYTRPRSEAEELFNNPSQPGEVKLPQDDYSTHRLKFSFGQTFAQLASTHISKTGEAKLTDFFLDLYDSSSTTVETVSDTNTTESGREAKLAPHILGHPPLMNSILQLNQTELETLVKWNLLWLRDFGFINKCQGEWLYAALAYIATPIEPTIMSDLRSIASILITIRSSISDWNTELGKLQAKPETNSLIESAENKDSKLFDFINSLNLFIYIITDYFQQNDLILN